MLSMSFGKASCVVLCRSGRHPVSSGQASCVVRAGILCSPGRHAMSFYVVRKGIKYVVRQAFSVRCCCCFVCLLLVLVFGFWGVPATILCCTVHNLGRPSCTLCQSFSLPAGILCRPVDSLSSCSYSLSSCRFSVFPQLFTVVL